MANRIATLRRAYTPVEAEAESFSLKSLAHQYERLGKALAATLDREDRANRALAETRAETLAAHMRKRAADELAARAEAGDMEIGGGTVGHPGTNAPSRCRFSFEKKTTKYTKSN